MCFFLTETNDTKNKKRTPGQPSDADGPRGEIRVLSLPNPNQITVLLNWHFNRKERNHFIVNIWLY